MIIDFDKEYMGKFLDDEIEYQEKKRKAMWEAETAKLTKALEEAEAAGATEKELMALRASMAARSQSAARPGPIARKWRCFRDFVHLSKPWLVCIAVACIWTPDKYKVDAMYVVEDAHVWLQDTVHHWYWWATMDKDRYEMLMRQAADKQLDGDEEVNADCPIPNIGHKKRS
jgi:hypothetical protein